MHLSKIALAALLIVPAALHAQTTVYSNNFSDAGTRGTLRTTGNTYNVGDWTIASGKNTTSSTGSGSIGVTAGGLDFGMASTTSGFVETQNRFTSSPVSLNVTGDYIQLKIVFTDKNNVLGGNSTIASNLAIGLYDTSSNNPAIGLQSSGLNGTTGSAFATGNAATWEGYLGQLRPSTGTNLLQARPVQNGVGTTSANQDLLFNGVTGGFNNPGPGGILNVSASSTLGLLTNAAQYTASLRITRAGDTSYTLLYSLADATNTQLQSISTTASNTAFLSNLSFDGLAFGYRFAAATGQGQVSGLTLTNIEVTSMTVPEPSSFAALAGLAGLGFAVARRRRST